MFVRLLTGLAGVNGSHGFGSVIEMEDEEAGRFIEANLAEEAEPPVVQIAPPEPPPADVPPSEPANPSHDELEAHRASDDGMPEPSEGPAAETKNQDSTTLNSDPA